MAAATICDGARAMYDALPAEVRPSECRFLDARGILGDPPHVQLDALRRYAAMDKTWAGFNKDLGYMGCVKAARAHNNRAPTPQPQLRAAPRTPQPSRPAPRRAVITPPPVPYIAPAAASAADSDEAWLAKTKGAATADEIAALEALRDRQLVARDEAFELIVRAFRETKTVPALVARATRLVDGLARTRHLTVEKSQIASSTPSPTRLARFVISPSTLGVFSHYGCARVLLRLAKRNAGLDYRVRATEASRGSTATKAFDSGAAIIAGEALTDRDVSEAAAALSMVSLVSGRGTDHERWLNKQLEDVGVACEGWFGSEVASEAPKKFKLVDVEQLARQRHGKFEDAYDALSLELLRDAPVGTALYQPALNVKLIGERRVYAALGLLDAFDRGDVSLSRALVDYVLVVRDAGRRSLVVIDAKASIRVKLEHQIQVTMYTMLIDVAEPGVCRVGGVWLPAKASPQIFEVGGLQKKVRELLATEVTDLLTADAHARDFDTDTDDWVLRGSCETCNFRASCEKQAADRGRLCALPGLRADDAVELQSFSAGFAGRNAIERLDRRARPSPRTPVSGASWRGAVAFR